MQGSAEEQAQQHVDDPQNATEPTRSVDSTAVEVLPSSGRRKQIAIWLLQGESPEQLVRERQCIVSEVHTVATMLSSFDPPTLTGQQDVSDTSTVAMEETVAFLLGHAQQLLKTYFDGKKAVMETSTSAEKWRIAVSRSRGATSPSRQGWSDYRRVCALPTPFRLHSPNVSFGCSLIHRVRNG